MMNDNSENVVTDGFRESQLSKLNSIIASDMKMGTNISWEINKQLILSSTVLLTIIGGFLSQISDTLSLIEKILGILTILLNVLSIIAGISQFFADQIFYDKHILKKMTLRKILNETILNGISRNDYGRFLEIYNTLTGSKSTYYISTAIQTSLFILGIITILIYVFIRII